ncbi:MAG TPA: DUF4190 domain-containing protein [Verrucomicrobiae bacterium]|jgi:competence protein ComGC
MTALPPIHKVPTTGSSKSGLAVASLVFGLCGVGLCLGPLMGIPAVICAHMARADIRKSDGKLRGAKMAMAGLVTGYISMVSVFVIIFLGVQFIPKFIEQKRFADHQTCISNLQMIQGYKEKWALDHGTSEKAIPPEQDIFGPGRYLEVKPECPTGGFYRLNAVMDSPACSVHGTIKW